MVIDHGSTSVAVRERGLCELYDLALPLCRRHAGRLALLALAGCLPWALLDGWLVAGGDGEAWWRWWLLLLLVSAQIPLATAPLTAFLGAALFTARPSARAALRQAAGCWGQLLFAGLWRALLTACPLLILLWSPHTVEVVVLERPGAAAARRRAAGLRRAWTGEWVQHLLASAAVLAAALWMVVGGWKAVRGVLLHADPWLDWAWADYLPGLSPAVHVALWLALAYLAVVRFLAYIDLRTRHEGWELGLLLRRAGRRIEERS